MNILQIISSHRWTGPVEPLIGLSENLVKNGHNVFFCCDTISGTMLADRAREKNIRVLEGLNLSIRFRLIPFLKDQSALRKMVIDNKIELINCHLLNDHIMSAMFLGESGKKVKIIRTVHDIKRLGSKLALKRLARSTDGFITISQNFKNLLLKASGIPGEKIEVIHGSVDIERFNTSNDGTAVRSAFGIMTDEKVIGLVARFQPGRGHKLLVKSFYEILKKTEKIKLMLVGRGEELDTIKTLVKKLNMQNSVVFTGYRQKDLPQVYSAMNLKVFIEPGSDGSCRAVLEAMASGLPVVAVNKGVIPETVEDSVSGYVVEKNLEELTKAIMKILNNKDKASKMGKKGRDIIENNYSGLVNSKKTLSYYEKVLSTNSEH